MAGSTQSHLTPHKGLMHGSVTRARGRKGDSDEAHRPGHNDVL